MARREREKREREEAIEAVKLAEAERARGEAAKDVCKVKLGPKIKEWSEVGD